MKSFRQMIMEEYSFSSVQVSLPICIAQKMIEFGKKIPQDELAEDGVEYKPHITIKYGIHSGSADVLSGINLPESLTITMGKTAMFSAPDYDVLIVDIDSQNLVDLNALIRDKIECTDTFPVYHPHATLAYMKKGAAKAYVGDDTFEGLTWTFASIEFSSKNDDGISTISLRG